MHMDERERKREGNRERNTFVSPPLLYSDPSIVLFLSSQPLYMLCPWDVYPMSNTGSVSPVGSLGLNPESKALGREGERERGPGRPHWPWRMADRRADLADGGAGHIPGTPTATPANTKGELNVKNEGKRMKQKVN